MSRFVEDVMDFGDEEEGGFLAGKLAALGIDEDLELSGCEEENEDPTERNEGVSNPNQDPHASGNGRLTQAETAESSNKSQSTTSSGVEEVADSVDPLDGATAATDPPKCVEDVSDRAELSADVTPRSNSVRGVTHRPRPCRVNDVGVRDGELLNMLEKPLQASRDTQKGSRRMNNTYSRATSQKGKRGRMKGGPRDRNVTIKECAKWACSCLNEPKLYLMCRVVATIGYNKTKALLEEVGVIQEAGGMPTADGSRKRTSGGVFFTLLKDHIEPPELKELYADEVRVKKERERERRAATKRKMEALEAGQIGMTPRDPPARHAIPSRVAGSHPRGAWGKRSRGAELSTVGSGEDRTLSTKPTPP